MCLLVIYCIMPYMADSKKEIIERSVKQLNTYGGGIGVLVTCEAKAIGLKSCGKVRVSAVRVNNKEYIIVEKFPLIEKD